MMTPEKILCETEVTATGGRDGKPPADGGKPTAVSVVASAHERCPYSNATCGNVDVKLTVI